MVDMRCDRVIASTAGASRLCLLLSPDNSASAASIKLTRRHCCQPIIDECFDSSAACGGAAK